MRLSLLSLATLTAVGYAQPDSAASLRIQFASSSSVFQVGEIIRVELQFTASEAGFEMSTRGYDRSVTSVKLSAILSQWNAAGIQGGCTVTGAKLLP